MSKTLTNGLGDATVRYHTDTFTKTKRAFIGIGAGIGISLLAIGILSYLNIIKGIPSVGTYCLLGGASVILLGDLIVVATMLVKREQKKKEIDEVFKGLTVDYWNEELNAIKSRPQDLHQKRFRHQSEKLKDFITKRKNNDCEVHFFSNTFKAKAMKKNLKSDGWKRG